MLYSMTHEVLGADGLMREVWTLHDLRDTGRVTIRSYTKQVRPTRRHGWKPTQEWHWAQNGRRTSLATVLDTHPPVSDDFKYALLTAWRNRYTLEV